MGRDRLRTSREVYDQIRWDARIDARAVVIGYDARRDGIQEIAFADFVPGGDIPWHRIWYFRDDRRRLWDREQRVDQLSGPGSVLDVAAPAGASGHDAPDDAALTRQPVYRFDAAAQAWVEASGEAAALPAALTVVSYNVLFERDRSEGLDTPARTRLLFELLRESRADLIALQEVTPPLLAEILAQDWIRASYHVSDDGAATTVTPYGLVLLSRLPVAWLGEHRFSRDKRILVADLGGTPALRIAVVHLVSDGAEGAAAIRARQLGVLLDDVVGSPSHTDGPDWIIAGDFNFGDEGPGDQLATAGLVDLWRELHPDDAGFTFDPARNPLAAITTLSGRSRRLDRVLARSHGRTWRPRAIALLGEDPAPSDHYGLRATFERRDPTARSGVEPGRDDLDAARQAAPVHRSALVVIPPEEVWAPIQRLRTAHDRHADRWMPHVTLVYGFVPEDHVPAAAVLLEQALAEIEPFTIRLAELELFRHRNSCTVWARPDADPPGRLRELQAVAQALFPRCNEQSGHEAGGFTAHLTLGQAGGSSAAATRAAWQREWQPVDFEVREVHVITRRGDEPFEVRRSIPLGRRSIERWLATRATIEPAARAARDRAIALVESACGAALAGMATVGDRHLRVVGSEAFGVAQPDSDIDLVCVGPGGILREQLFDDVAMALAASGEAVHTRAVLDAISPVLVLDVGGIHLDLQYAELPGDVALSVDRLDAAVLARLDPVSQRAVQSALEPEAVLARVEGAVGAERYRRVLRAVRAWARARGVDSNALGYPGGLSWAILTAHAVVHAPAAARRSLPSLLEHCFTSWARWSWPSPVAITDAGSTYRAKARDVMPVLTPLPPVANSARNVSRSTLAVLTDEWTRATARARRIASGRDAADVLFEPLDPLRTAGHFLVLEIEAADPDHGALAGGWLDGSVTALVIDLEADPELRVRPLPGLPPRSGGIGIVLALTGSPDDATLGRAASAAARFVVSFEAWGDRPASTRLTVALATRADLAQRLGRDVQPGTT